MITIEDKTYRNLEEQVQYLTDMIMKATDVVKNITGKVADAASLPDPTIFSPGTTFAVGSSAPFEYYVDINSKWVYIGRFPLAGEAGADGEDGNGVYKTSANVSPSTTAIGVQSLYNPDGKEIQKGDLIIGGANASLFLVTSIDPHQTIAIVNYVMDLKAPTGPTGPAGATGATGPTGPTGPAGYSVFYANQALTPSSTDVFIVNVNNPGNLDFKIGDLIVGGANNSLFYVSSDIHVPSGLLDITYLCDLSSNIRYQHNITMVNSSADSTIRFAVTFSIVNNHSAAYTSINDIAEALYSAGYDNAHLLQASGAANDGTNTLIAYGVRRPAQNTIYCSFVRSGTFSIYGNMDITQVSSFNDNIRTV